MRTPHHLRRLSLLAAHLADEKIEASECLQQSTAALGFTAHRLGDDAGFQTHSNTEFSESEPGRGACLTTWPSTTALPDRQ